jgi:hypothetical protein
MAHAFWGHFRVTRGRLASVIQQQPQKEAQKDENDRPNSWLNRMESISARYKPAYYAKHFPPKLRALEVNFREWATRVFAVVGGSVGYTPGTLLHLWHGNNANRQYESRFSCLMKGRFDPEVDVTVGDQGAWEWTTTSGQQQQSNGLKQDMHQCVKAFFASRAEDGDGLQD